jgi:hypothetical protein
MFVYFSALVEGFKFSKIYINFLIVGHTHASIDQFFSTLSKAIQATSFIGTPTALMHLFMMDRSRTKNTLNFKIGMARQIEVYYDYIALFAPYVNTHVTVSIARACTHTHKHIHPHTHTHTHTHTYTHILTLALPHSHILTYSHTHTHPHTLTLAHTHVHEQGYQIPHNFVIERQFDLKACTQYKLFVSDPTWLPVRPVGDLQEQVAADILENNPVDIVQLSPTFGMTGGPANLKEHLYIGEGAALNFHENEDTAQAMNDLRGMQSDLLRVNEAAMNQQFQRMTDEGETGECKRHSMYRKSVQKSLVDLSNKTEGFIIWIDQLPGKPNRLTKKNPTNAVFVDLPPLDQAVPEPFNPQFVIDRLAEVKEAVNAKKAKAQRAGATDEDYEVAANGG